MFAETSEGQFETVATVPTAHGARAIAADPALHLLFTPTADFRAPAASSADKAARPEPIAGNFRLLVLKDGDAH